MGASLTKSKAQRHITARMYIGAPAGRLGLRGAAARRSATWPFALVGLRATSHTCDTLYAIAPICHLMHNKMLDWLNVVFFWTPSADLLDKGPQRNQMRVQPKLSTLLNRIPRDVRLLYHYTTKEKALEKILQSGKLRLNALENTNDPRENKYWLLNVLSTFGATCDYNDFYVRTMDEFNDRLKTHCRITAFSTDDESFEMDQNGRNGYAHSRMWAQYGGNHTGVCLLFNQAKLLHSARLELSELGTLWDGRVTYGMSYEKDDPNSPFHLNYRNADSVDLHIREHYMQLLFEKSADWKSECEYRLVVYSPTKIAGPFEIRIHDSICGLIVGVDFPEVYNGSVSEQCDKYRISADHIQWQRGEPLLAHPIYDYEYEHQNPSP